MTKEEKQLLLKDLCARLPYRVICDMWFEGNESDKITEVLKCGGLMRLMNSELNFITKPYLRPMSSMTEKERKEIENIFLQDTQEIFKDPVEIRASSFYDADALDWYLKKHFDYRKLIEKGLALEAPEGMYKED